MYQLQMNELRSILGPRTNLILNEEMDYVLELGSKTYF